MDATMVWKDHAPRPDDAVTRAADVKPASHARPGILVTSQAPSREIAPMAGTWNLASCKVLLRGPDVHQYAE
jgi:hypothetical protein